VQVLSRSPYHRFIRCCSYLLIASSFVL